MIRVFPDELLGSATIYVEGRGESYLGQVAIGEVIRNRMAQRIFSNGTVDDTIFQRKQFAGWEDHNRMALGSVETEDPAWRSCVRAWAESATSIVTRGASHYLNPTLVIKQLGSLPAWAGDPNDPMKFNELLVTLREGRHVFLRLR